MKCSFCGADIPGPGAFCSACGKKAMPVPALACGSCGGQMTEEQAFCTSCGAKAGTTSEMAVPPPPPPPQRENPTQKDSFPGAGPARGAAVCPGSQPKGAGVGVRAAATAVDTIIFIVISYFLAALSGSTTSDGFALKGASFFAVSLVVFAYYLFFEGSFGATPGKLVLGLRVVKKDGGRCGFGAAVARTVFRLIDGFVFYLPAAVFVWVTPLNQRLGDLVAGTLVVKGGKSQD